MTSYHSSIDASGAKPDASTVSGHFGSSDFFFFSIDFSDRPPRFEPEFDPREPNAEERVGLFEKFFVSEAKYAPKIVHKNSCAILLIMPMLNMDVRSRSFRNKTPAFLFLGNHRLGSAPIVWKPTMW